MQRLRNLVERIERLTEEKAGVGDELAVVYAEAKAAGYESPYIRRLIQLRKVDTQEREEQEGLVEVYAEALGIKDEELAEGYGSNSFDPGPLKAFIERIERLEEERAGLQDDMRDLFTEAKGNGFDGKAIRACLKLRKKAADERREEAAKLRLYKRAIGM